MRFHVFVWLRRASVAAEVFQSVQAESAALALQAVMQQCGLHFASYAWVVPEDDEMDCYEVSPVLHGGPFEGRRLKVR